MDEWLSSARARLVAAIDVDEASPELDEELLLGLARFAAHSSSAILDGDSSLSGEKPSEANAKNVSRTLP